MLSALALSVDYISLLNKHGFETRQEVSELSPTELAKELSISNEEALKIWKTAKYGDDCQYGEGERPAKASALDTGTGSGSGSGSRRHSSRSGGSVGPIVNLCSRSVDRSASALSLLRERMNQRAIFTLCRELDIMCMNGIQVGQVTEFCGVPGIGKTQLGMQLACTVQIPKILGGTGGQAVYIDTEGSFMPRRAQQIAKGVKRHLDFIISQRDDKKMQSAAKSLTSDTILKNIFCFRVYDHVDQQLCIQNLEHFVRQNPKVKIVVLDSVAFHFRHGFTDDYAKRSRMLAKMANTLTALARTQNLAVVIINHVTTKITATSASIQPALGPVWAHSCTNRIMLEWQGKKRIARLVKSPSCKTRSIQFEIGLDGIRDVGYYDDHMQHPSPKRIRT